MAQILNHGLLNILLQLSTSSVPNACVRLSLAIWERVPSPNIYINREKHLEVDASCVSLSAGLMSSWVKASQSVGSNKETEGNVNLVIVEQEEGSNGL